MKYIVLIGILCLFLIGCARDTYVGTVKEIKTVSAGGFGSTDKALVVLEDDRVIVVSYGIGSLEVGSEIRTSRGLSGKYAVAS